MHPITAAIISLRWHKGLPPDVVRRRAITVGTRASQSEFELWEKLLECPPEGDRVALATWRAEQRQRELLLRLAESPIPAGREGVALLLDVAQSGLAAALREGDGKTVLAYTQRIESLLQTAKTLGAESDAAAVDAGLAEERAMLQGSYLAFARAAWRVLEPTTPLVEAPYLEAIAAHLEALDELKWLMIHIAPRSGKTTLISVIYQAWRWATNPALRVLAFSWGDDRVTTDARLMRKLVSSPWYQARWPLTLSGDQNQKGRFENTRGGYRYTGIYGTGATGDGGDLLQFDDPQTGADQASATELERDQDWFYGTALSRRNQRDASPLLFCAQRLGPWDLANRLRLDNPGRWHVLAFEAKKTLIDMATYYRRTAQGVETVDLPLIDTALSRRGLVCDARQPGEMLTPLITDEELSTYRLSVREAQFQQRPVLVAEGAAKIGAFDRARHVRGWCLAFGAASYPEATATALRQGWRFGLGLDHGVGARRQVAVIVAWHQQLRRIHVLGVYLNSSRTTPAEDAAGIQRELDALGLVRSVMTDSRGDVGSTGKGAGGAAEPINAELSRLLGFPIHTARKEAGSIEAGVELLNQGYGSDSIHIDPRAVALADAHECWTGGEQHKDVNDAFRYLSRELLESFQASRQGAGGWRVQV